MADHDFLVHFERLRATQPVPPDGFTVAPPSPNTIRRFLRARKGQAEPAAQQYLNAELWRHSRVKKKKPALLLFFLLLRLASLVISGDRVAKLSWDQTQTSTFIRRSVRTSRTSLTNLAARFAIPFFSPFSLRFCSDPIRPADLL